MANKDRSIPRGEYVIPTEAGEIRVYVRSGLNYSPRGVLESFKVVTKSEQPDRQFIRNQALVRLFRNLGSEVPRLEWQAYIRDGLTSDENFRNINPIDSLFTLLPPNVPGPKSVISPAIHLLLVRQMNMISVLGETDESIIERMFRTLYPSSKPSQRMLVCLALRDSAEKTLRARTGRSS